MIDTKCWPGITRLGLPRPQSRSLVWRRALRLVPLPLCALPAGQFSRYTLCSAGVVVMLR